MDEEEARELARNIEQEFYHPLYSNFTVEVEACINGMDWKVTVI